VPNRRVSKRDFSTDDEAQPRCRPATAELRCFAPRHRARRVEASRRRARRKERAAKAVRRDQPADPAGQLLHRAIGSYRVHSCVEAIGSSLTVVHAPVLAAFVTVNYSQGTSLAIAAPDRRSRSPLAPATPLSGGCVGEPRGLSEADVDGEVREDIGHLGAIAKLDGRAGGRAMEHAGGVRLPDSS
jgi:hypothetical protein